MGQKTVAESSATESLMLEGVDAEDFECYVVFDSDLSTEKVPSDIAIDAIDLNSPLLQDVTPESR